MEKATVSTKFQVVIPQKVRESLGIKSGQKVQVIPFEERIELIPIEPMEKSRGFLKGIDNKHRERNGGHGLSKAVHEPRELAGQSRRKAFHG